MKTFILYNTTTGVPIQNFGVPSADFLPTPDPGTDFIEAPGDGYITQLNNGVVEVILKPVSADKTLGAAKARKRDEIVAERARRERLPFTYNSERYKADSETQQRIQFWFSLATAAVVANEAFQAPMELADGSAKLLTRAECIGLGKALFLHIRDTYATARDLLIQVRDATTVAQVAAITWP